MLRGCEWNSRLYRLGLVQRQGILASAVCGSAGAPWGFAHVYAYIALGKLRICWPPHYDDVAQILWDYNYAIRIVQFISIMTRSWPISEFNSDLDSSLRYNLVDINRLLRLLRFDKHNWLQYKLRCCYFFVMRLCWYFSSISSPQLVI